MSPLECEAAEGLVALATAKWRSVGEAHAALSGSSVQAALLAGDRQDAACAEFKARFYPRRAGHVVATEGGIYLRSPSGRVTTIYKPVGAR